MEESIESHISPAVVWQAWERFQEGQKGKQGAFQYQILEVEQGKGFSILWKSLFVRFVFTHRVEPVGTGSRISYHIQIRGPFAFPLKLLISHKLKKSVSALLKSFVKQLESA